MNTITNIKTVRDINAGMHLRDYIINGIKSQSLKPGESLYSTQKLSAMFEISLGTAQKVLKQLGNEGYLLRESRKKTLVAAQPSQSLKKYKFDKIGIATSSMHNPFHHNMIELISEKSLEQDVKLYMGQGSKELDFIDKMENMGVSAYIHIPYFIDKEVTTWGKLKSKNIKTVVLNDFWNNGGPFNSVQTNEEYGIMEMMSHLISLGHRKIVFLDETDTEPRDKARCAYMRALRRHEIEFDADLVKYVSAYNIRGVSTKLMDDILQLGTAVICIYDYYAMQILDILKEKGLQAGKDLSVAGFDDIHEAEEHELTTIVQPIQKLVNTAFGLLRNTGEIKKMMINPECIFRKSTGPLRNT